MAIHWQLKFKSLRADTLYTVNIYDDAYGGNPVSLIGAADPFYTQEDDDDDIFMPIRTQSGYIRIIDTGDSGFNWRSIIPLSDTARPVTLTHVEGGATVTDWMGFIQAQNFGYKLFEKPIELDLPIQCPLSVISNIDVDYTNTGIKNFAYLLKSIVDSIHSTSRPTRFFFQGGADAQSWLLKKIDWQNFITLNDDNQIEAKYSLQECLEGMCLFWGWTVRINGNALYFESFDDQTEHTFLYLSDNDLSTMADGTAAGTTSETFQSASISDVYADTENEDFQNRGYSKVIITSDANEADAEIIDPFTQDMVAEMNDTTWNAGYIVQGDHLSHYTPDILDASNPFLVAQAASGYASFNILSAKTDSEGGYNEVGNVIHIKKTKDSTTFVSLSTKYQHSFQDGFFRILADTYRDGEKYEDGGDFFAGNNSMDIFFGIGLTPNNANWWNGKEWVSAKTSFGISIGNKKPELFTRYANSEYDIYESSVIEVADQRGYIFIEILGLDSRMNFPEINGEKVFDLKDFRVEFTKNSTVSRQQFPNSGYWEIKPKTVKDKYKYKATNSNAVREEYDESNIFASDKKMKFGCGIVLNENNSYMSTISYNGGAAQHPEQHKANRIAGYWATSKRKITAHVMTHNGTSATAANSLTPRYLVSIAGSVMYPISISRRWRDDIAEILFMENNN